jgi:hypothetical protein
VQSITPRRSVLLIAAIAILLTIASRISEANPSARALLSSTPALQSIPYQVIDAEYSRSLDRIVAVSASPHRLHIYNPASDSGVAVDLPRLPLSVSVGPDGHYAAVGHDALVSYVDLRDGRLVKTLNLTAEAADIVLAGNGKVYISPVRDQWVNLHAIDIATNTEVLGTGIIRADTRYKLHPDGTSLYGANRGLSPSDIEKIDITAHPPANLYDSPYHGDYPMCGDLWMSEDGLRIFTACGNVFRASAVRAQDMTYNGSLAATGLASIRHLTHSQAANKVLGIPSATDTQVVLANYEHLTLDRKVALPPFVVGGASYSSHGRFVFANAAGTAFYTIVQANPNAALLRDFGVVTSSFAGVVDPAPTATATPTPGSGPVFESNFPSGAPGSVFVLTASGFPPNTRASIAIRRPGESEYQHIVTLPLDGTGRLVFVLVTSPYDPPGTYSVRITVFSQGQLATTSSLVREQTVVLGEQEDQRSEMPPETVPIVNTSNLRVFLPIVRR